MVPTMNGKDTSLVESGYVCDEFSKTLQDTVTVRTFVALKSFIRDQSTQSPQTRASRSEDLA